jgi:hypothetical protein
VSAQAQGVSPHDYASKASANAAQGPGEILHKSESGQRAAAGQPQDDTKGTEMGKSEDGTEKSGITRAELLKAAAVATPAFLLGRPADAAAAGPRPRSLSSIKQTEPTRNTRNR